MHDKNLNQSQKFLLAEIEQLSQLQKGCIASNKHFHELIGISRENVSRNLSDLVKKGYINIETIKGSRNHDRIITPLLKQQDPLTKVVSPPYQSSKTPLLKQQETKENRVFNRTVNKENPLNIPDNLNLTAWDELIVHRKSKGKFTNQAKQKIINKLAKHSFEDQQKMIDMSIENNWAGVFELKDSGGTNHPKGKGYLASHARPGESWEAVELRLKRAG